MSWKTWTLALAITLMALLGAPVRAQGLGALQRGDQASLAVNLDLVIDPQGAVARYTFDRPELLPAAVTELLAKAVPEWRFEIPKERPDPVHIDVRATITMVARRVEADRFELGIGGARFRSDRVIDPFTPLPAGSRYLRAPPTYPPDLRSTGASSQVDLIVMYDRDGNVLDVVAEKVSLRAFGMPKRLAYMRKRFAEAAIEAARGWSAPPAIARSAAGKETHWRVRVPVAFEVESAAGYGEWQAYVPGPHHAAPWDVEAGSSPTPPIAGEIHDIDIDDAPRLLSPLQPAP